MKYIIIFILLINSLNANKQDFSVIINKPFNANLFGIVEDYDRTISAVGFSKNYNQKTNISRSYSDAFEYLATVSKKYGSQMHLIKVNNSANVTLSKVSHLSKFNEAVALVKTPTNGYFVGGYTMDGSLLVMKLDNQGNTHFIKTFGTKNYDKMNNLILLSDGGVLAIGSSITSRDSHDNIFNTGLGNNDIFLTRFSREGHILWSKKYGTLHDDRGIDAVEARDGSIIVIGTTSHKKSRDVTIMRITENGNKIWLKHYGEKVNTTDKLLPKKIIRLKDNNFLIALSQLNSMQKEHIRFIKLDLYQNILIDREIFTTYPSVINDIKEFSNGNIIAVGYVQGSYNTDALAMILDSTLTLLNQEHYGDNNYDIFNATTILHNSQIAVAGAHTATNSQETDMWIVKLNSDASMVKLPVQSDDFYTELCKLFQQEINNKEIRIYRDLTIELTAPRILFKVGESKLTQIQKLFLEKFSAKLISFLYHYKKRIQRFEVDGHTSQEWAKVSFKERYLKNEKLSLNRSYETLQYIFSQEPREVQEWLITVLKGSGYSYSQKMNTPKKSRRVSFKIYLK